MVFKGVTGLLHVSTCPLMVLGCKGKVCLAPLCLARGFDNFNLSLDESKLNVGKRRRVTIQRGEAEFHSAYTIHRSDPNRSTMRRLAWIVRYCATGTRVVPGVRGSFDEGYRLVPVMGRGAVELEGLHSVDDKEDGRVVRSIYAPCFGNAVKELKK